MYVGMIRVGWQRRKGSKWWNEEVSRAVAEKRRAFAEKIPIIDIRYREWL